LESIDELKSFRSIVIRKNELGALSVHFLDKILKKRVPNHLEELKIENCQMPQSVIESIVDELIEGNYLKILSLVKLNMNA